MPNTKELIVRRDGAEHSPIKNTHMLRAVIYLCSRRTYSRYLCGGTFAQLLLRLGAEDSLHESGALRITCPRDKRLSISDRIKKYSHQKTSRRAVDDCLCSQRLRIRGGRVSSFRSRESYPTVPRLFSVGNGYDQIGG
ncbi:hypothetical protein RB195_020632 [Necator americanus]|uniref:Uncharacterized protein n=1 Tax=Necator americanus TaxID=51031 RepID=A0ABR1CJP7_NECAM